MKITPTFDEAVRLADDYKVVPVSCEIYSDAVTPIEVLRKLKYVSRHCYLLESAFADEKWGRFTFLGYDPKMEITCMDGVMKIKSGSTITVETQTPGKTLREIINDYKSPVIEGMPPFTGGLVGYFAYDYIKYSEPNLKITAEDRDKFKDFDLMLFDKVIAFDNYKQKIILIANCRCDSFESEYHKAERELLDMRDLILNGSRSVEVGRALSEPRPLFSQEEYCKMVEKAKQYITDGDIFQVVLSNRIEMDFEGSLLDTYRVLRATNPSPYMFYFSGEDVEIAGASPETLVKLEGGELHTFPLAGTRPRGKTESEDAALESELLSDEKECAEHNMLVDLGRNDLGRICKFGTVDVERYMEVLRFSHVMHIGSTVRGDIDEKYDALDAIASVLPAGTLSGAPKFRACQIIDELENNKRGIYGGAIGYIDFAGNMDTCIAIRIAYKKNNKVFVRSGAGIVADSVPEKEYRECINKAQAVISAISEAQGGIDNDFAD